MSRKRRTAADPTGATRKLDPYASSASMLAMRVGLGMLIGVGDGMKVAVGVALGVTVMVGLGVKDGVLVGDIVGVKLGGADSRLAKG